MTGIDDGLGKQRDDLETPEDDTVGYPGETTPTELASEAADDEPSSDSGGTVEPSALEDAPAVPADSPSDRHQEPTVEPSAPQDGSADPGGPEPAVTDDAAESALDSEPIEAPPAEGTEASLQQAEASEPPVSGEPISAEPGVPADSSSASSGLEPESSAPGDPAPPEDEPAPSPADPAPSEDEPTPSPDDPAPPEHDPAPSPDDPAPFEEEPVPSSATEYTESSGFDEEEEEGLEDYDVGEQGGPGDEVPEGHETPMRGGGAPGLFDEADEGEGEGGAPPSRAGRKLAEQFTRASGVRDNPTFDTQGAPMVVRGGFEIRPVEKSIEDGLSFLLLGKSPSKYLNERAQAIIKAGGNRVESVGPGDPMLIPPHAAQNRVVAGGVDPQSTVRKAAARRRQFDDDLLGGAAPVVPAPLAPMAPPALPPTISPAVPFPAAPSSAVPPVIAPAVAPVVSPTSPPPVVAAPVLPEEVAVGTPAPALRYHGESGGERTTPPSDQTKSDKAPADKPPAEKVAAAKAPTAKTSTERAPLPWGWIAGVAAAIGVFVVVGNRPKAEPGRDVVVVYAMDQREHAVAYLTREIGMLEVSIAGTEVAITEVSRGLTGEPTAAQWMRLQALVRERNAQAMALEALRLRRKMVLGVVK